MTEEEAKESRSGKRKRKEYEETEPAWVEKVMDRIAGVVQTMFMMEERELEWRRTIEERLDEMKTAVDGLYESDEEETLKENVADETEGAERMEEAEVVGVTENVAEGDGDAEMA
jgi:hypothetical protein